MSKQYAIDLPNPFDPEGVWMPHDYFESREEAIAAAKALFGADDEGRINIISEFDREDVDDETE